MANFKVHISCGVLAGGAAAAAGVLTGLLNPAQAVTAFTVAVFASALPDLDSDNARPTEILFGMLGIVCPVLIWQNLPRERLQSEEIFCFLLFSYLFFQYVLAWVFFRFTKHRGMFHSIPAALIAGAVAYLLFQHSVLVARCFFAGCAAGGYLVHLTLDELWSADLPAMRLKKSAGTALKLKGESVAGTLCVYAVLGILVWRIILEK